MFVDHIGYVFFPDQIIFRIIGRLSFPIFAWGIANGYVRTKNIKKYGQRLLLLAFISQPFFYLVINKDLLNICFSLFLGLLTIFFYDKSKEKKVFLFFIPLILFLAFFFRVDYGVYGVLMILFFHVFRKDFRLISSQSVLAFVHIFLNPTAIFQVFSLPAFLIIYYFKHLDFKINRYFQYSFYPLHLAVIYLIDSLL